jgi:polar amino acid transport system substrate-binding protein
MRRHTPIVPILLVLAFAGREARSAPAAPARPMSTVDDIRDKRIGVLMGSIHDTWARKNYPSAEILEYHNIPDMLFGLSAGKIDVCFRSKVSVVDVLAKNADLGVLAEDLFSVPIAVGFNQDDGVLRQEFNAFLAELRASGVYQDMVSRWMDRQRQEMPAISGAAAPIGALRVGIVSDMGLPFCILKDGQLAGFDVELGRRFAAHAGKEYVPVDLPFSSMLASLSTHKIDLVTSTLTVTEERKKQISFSDSYYKSEVVALARKKDIARYVAEGASAVRKPFAQRLSESFYSNLILERRYLQILGGLKITIIISVLAALFGTIVGALVCYLRMSKNRALSGAASAYIMVLRGTPVLVLMMIIYYVVFGAVNINPVLVSVIAFGMNLGAYVSEIFRTSIQSVDRGQSEAAIAGGFTHIQAFFYIILPQALRSILPLYQGQLISMVKMTSIVGYIAVRDLTKAGDIIRSHTFDAFFPLLMVALIYFLLAWLLTWALGKVEISIEPRRRRERSRERAAA